MKHSNDIPVMDQKARRGSIHAVSISDIHFVRNSAKPGKPVHASFYGDPPPDLAYRRANPGIPAHISQKLDTMGRKLGARAKNEPKSCDRIKHEDAEHERAINTIRERLKERGMFHSDLQKALAAHGVHIGQSQLKHVMSGRYAPRDPGVIPAMKSVLGLSE